MTTLTLANIPPALLQQAQAQLQAEHAARRAEIVGTITAIETERDKALGKARPRVRAAEAKRDAARAALEAAEADYRKADFDAREIADHAQRRIARFTAELRETAPPAIRQLIDAIDDLIEHATRESLAAPVSYNPGLGRNVVDPEKQARNDAAMAHLNGLRVARQAADRLTLAPMTSEQIEAECRRLAKEAGIEWPQARKSA